MPEQDPHVRAGNFDEVALGYSAEDAIAEAERCLQCKEQNCKQGCPVEVDIPEFIAEIKEGRFAEAARVIRRKNNLPAICGRVCPQENQCEQYCLMGKKFEPVGIGRLERFVADYALQNEQPEESPARESASGSGRRVAVVGSGPAGLTCAADLARMGYQVTIFEALHKSGGVLVYGIPEFRLPKRVVQTEIDYVQSLGVEIKVNTVISKTLSVDELLDEFGFEAVFIGTGAGAPRFMRIPGENLIGVYSANEFLTRTNLMKAYLFPEYATPIRVGRRVAVVGAGNVAVDSARTALRLGAESVQIFYRRSRDEMPARLEEFLHAEEEGIEFNFLINPVRIIGDERGWVTGMECIRMTLGEPDESGRRSPVPVDGSNCEFEVDTVVIAIGQSPNPLVPRTTPGLEIGRRGTIVADEETGQTSREGVFAGGDIVTGAATVILAMGAGKKAARAIDAYLSAKY
ncbi:MAG: NADPH-dependent glutamate synthase [Desulforudis sp.]|nr:NADPH-dependent glutamate synthase [Clostridia bacterium]MDQ7792339.1 NADPH-dependent glutamate synthase [Clostridia bacterium]RJX18021.1 MAG: NADPH-dependent glutamate synthase [Desulforudis sp.]